MEILSSSKKLNPEAESFFPTPYAKISHLETDHPFNDDDDHRLSYAPVFSPSSYPVNPFKFPPSRPSLLPLPPPPPSYTYMVHCQPFTRKPTFLKPLRPPRAAPVGQKGSNQKMKRIHPLTPVPSGPRTLRNKVGGRRGGVVVRSDTETFHGDCPGGGGRWKWLVKGKNPRSQAGYKSDERSCTSSRVSGEPRRWKNKFRAYEEILPLNLEDKATSVMIRNIPNKYNRKLLFDVLDKFCMKENEKLRNDDDNDDGSLISAYDFVYLPIDFQRRVNAGFAFVNFTNPEAALRFRDAFHGKGWDLFGSPKIAEITKARIQGKEELVENCMKMNFGCGSEEDLPVWFDPARDGSGQETKMHPVGRTSRFAKKRSENHYRQ